MHTCYFDQLQKQYVNLGLWSIGLEINLKEDRMSSERVAIFKENINVTVNVNWPKKTTLVDFFIFFFIFYAYMQLCEL